MARSSADASNNAVENIALDSTHARQSDHAIVNNFAENVGIQVGQVNQSTINFYSLPNNAPPGSFPRHTGDTTLPSAVHNLPDLPSTVFVGRAEAMEQLERALGDGVVAVTQNVTGLGGVGKTTLALNYAHAHLNDHTSVWWLDASSATTLEHNLADLAHHLVTEGERGWRTDRAAADRAVRELQTHPGWLLVIDNADDPETVREILGRLRAHGRIVITSRVEFRSASMVRLDILNQPESLNLLQARSERPVTSPPATAEEVGAAHGITELLGGLPLALDHAASYIYQCKISYAQYLESLRRDTRATLMLVPFGEHGAAVARTWNVTLDVIARDDRDGQLALKILHICALYAADAIPRSLLAPLADNDPAAVNNALALLARYSMISLSEEMLSVHRLVQAVTRASTHEDARLGEGGADRIRAEATALLNSAAPGDHTGTSAWLQWRRLIAHLHALAENIPSAADTAETAALLDRTALYLVEEGGLADEETVRTIREYTDRAANAYERIFGPRDVKTLNVRRTRAWLSGNASAILAASADLEQVVGVDDPGFLVSLHDRAWTHLHQADFAAAERLFRRALASQRRLPDQLHNQLATQYGLGYALLRQGRLSEAEETLADCLQQRELSLAPAHPHTLITKRLLAQTIALQGRAESARAMLRETLQAQQRTFQEGHYEIRETKATLDRLGEHPTTNVGALEPNREE